MANTNVRFYWFTITVTYHDVDDKSQPDYYDRPYFTRRRITFGPNADLNDTALRFIHEKCDSEDVAQVYRRIRIQFPQAYREFRQTGQLRLWRQYRPDAPYARWYLQELRAHRHTSRDH